MNHGTERKDRIMRKRKQVFAAVLAGVMAFSLTACGKTDTAQGQTESIQQTESTGQTEPVEETIEEANAASEENENSEIVVQTTAGLGNAVNQEGTDNNSQNLNIWTPGVNDGKKRPVMVWLHGGGFSTGSANEEGYDSENLSCSGDVVVVSVNHRLNVFGYLDLSAYREKYKDSANVGIRDIVASLEWIQDNIEGFGGDPM